MKQVARVLLIVSMLPFLMWNCSSDNSNTKENSSPSKDHDPEEMLPGGDDIYELQEMEQVEIILQVDNLYDHLGNVAAQSLYFENKDGGVGNLDTIYVYSKELYPEDETYEQGIYKVWLQHIDRGSIGPFVSFMDSTIEFVQHTDTTYVYDFRID